MLFKISGRRKTNFVEKGGRRKKLEGNTRPPPPEQKAGCRPLHPANAKTYGNESQKKEGCPGALLNGGGGRQCTSKRRRGKGCA